MYARKNQRCIAKTDTQRSTNYPGFIVKGVGKNNGRRNKYEEESPQKLSQICPPIRNHFPKRNYFHLQKLEHLRRSHVKHQQIDGKISLFPNLSCSHLTY